ncbi:PREDICTED: uncharacterized protein LOC106814459 [Priapulus caudatus]|uniref:Uncharacterized protein LOC106814459 n=1 Tax=Priapulus caudatus TaxID=37621 RepID=A0ABM1EPY9_PRICU|nr:PREDICTED: uncharacterized protein LOC106814459 [Priapulus caudatus]
MFDFVRNASIDVYLKLYLVTKRGRRLKKKSRLHRSSAGGEVQLEEGFRYQLPAAVREAKVQVLLCAHRGKLFRNRLLGEVLLTVDALPLDALVCDWYKLIRKTHRA